MCHKSAKMLEWREKSPNAPVLTGDKKVKTGRSEASRFNAPLREIGAGTPPDPIQHERKVQKVQNI